MDGPDQLLLLDEYDIIVSDFERNHPKLLHAKTGAGVAKYVFGECDEVCRAIYWHTTGKPDMALMEKIVYIADYMEPKPELSRGGGTAQGGLPGPGPGTAEGL